MSTPRESVSASVARPKPEPSSLPEFRRLSDALGAEVTGIDLSKPLDEHKIDALKGALLAHQLLIVPDQHLTSGDIERFAREFGEIEGNIAKSVEGNVFEAVHSISNLDANGLPSASPMLRSNYNWHSDKSYLPVPSFATMLYGVEVPASGGDTEFANTARAYEDLPDNTKAKLAGLQVVQSFGYMLEGIGCPAIVAGEVPPPVVHPLVRTHPDTGQKCLNVGMYSQAIPGMDPAEAKASIDSLIAHATQRKYVFTQKWRQHDFVLWDNRCTLHRAIANYDMGTQRRVLLRCVVRGTAPQ